MGTRRKFTREFKEEAVRRLGKELTTVASETLGDSAIQVEVTLPVRPRRHESRKRGQPASVTDAGSGSRIPRITRLMGFRPQLPVVGPDAHARGGYKNQHNDCGGAGYGGKARQ
jgi:hypothetical protein